MAKKCNKTMDMAEEFNWKQGHGGKRNGAGRKKGIETKTMRVPVDLIPEFTQRIEIYKKEMS